MRDAVEIRPEREPDQQAVGEVHTLAFADEGQVAALVGDLRIAVAPVAPLSLVPQAGIPGSLMIAALVRMSTSAISAASPRQPAQPTQFATADCG